MTSLAEILACAGKFNNVDDMKKFVYSEHDQLSPEERISQEELEEFVAGIVSAIEAQSTVFNPEYMDSILEKEEVPANKEDKFEAAYKFSMDNVAKYGPDETEIYINTHLKKHFKLTLLETRSIIKEVRKESKNSKKPSFIPGPVTKESNTKKYGKNINSEILDNWSEYITPAVDHGSYRLDNHGIIRIVQIEEDGKIKVKSVEVCRSPFILCGVSKPINGTNIYYKVRYASGIDGSVKEAWIDHTDLITKKGINSKLLPLGINCPENTLQTSTIEYISKSIAEFRTVFKREYSAVRCGWNEAKDVFVLGTRKITNEGIEDILPLGVDSEFEELNKKGTLENWMDAAKPILEYDVARFKVYDAFTAPLNFLLGTESHIMDHYGDTSEGKTLTAKIALSMVGNPNEGLSCRADSTPKGILLGVKQHSDLPFLIDETDMGGDGLLPVVYGIANEIGRLKSTKDGKVDGGEIYRSSTMLTGENSIRDRLTNSGQMLRVFELNDSLPKLDSGKVKEIYDAIKGNYGHIIDFYMQEVFRMKDDGTLKEVYEDCYEKLPETTTNVEGRSKNIFACIMTAGKILEKVFDDIGFSTKNPEEIVNKYFFQCICEKPVEMEHIRALRIILDWVQSDYGSFTICNEKEELFEGHGFKRNGYIDENYIDVIGACLTEKLDKQNGLKSTKIKERLAKEGIIAPKTGKNWQFKRNGKPCNGIRIYRKKAEEVLGFNNDTGGITDVPYNSDVKMLIRTVNFLTEVHGKAEKSLINQIVNIDTESLLCMLVKNGKIIKVDEDTYKSF